MNRGVTIDAMENALHHVIEQVRSAHSQRRPLRVCGGGTKGFYGQPVQGEALSTQGLSGIVSYEPSELVITALAGTPLPEIEDTLAQSGQYLAFEPPHFLEDNTTTPNATSTLGGMVAAGLSGPARASVGAVRDFVLGLHMVNGKAEHLQFGGQVMKNVAGYDISRLMAGSWGTLGLITQVSLKVLPIPVADATLVFELPQALALEQINRWCGQPLPINASCWVADDTPKLFVRLRGAQAAVEAACVRMLKDKTGHRMDAQVAAADWRACADHRQPIFAEAPADQWLWRLSVPPTTGVMLTEYPQLIEWHGGLRWVWAPQEAAPLIREAAAKVQGSATVFKRQVESGLGAAHTSIQALQALAPPLDQLHRQIKAAFDPAGIFNPGRLYANL